MATRTIPPTACTQGPQASRVSNPSSILRPTFGSTVYRCNDTSVFHTPSNNIMNYVNSRDSVPIDHSPSEAMAQSRINEPSPSPGHSLFSCEWSEPSVSQEDLVDEMNAVTINRGKRPLRNLRIPSTASSRDELGPEDSSSMSQEVESTHDLIQHSTTLIADQDIQIDDVKNCVYHTGCPELTLPADDIWDAEIVKLRSKFLEPFSRDDPSPLRCPPEYPPIGFSGPVPSGSGNQPSQNFPSGNVGGFPSGDPPNNPSSGAGGNLNDDNFGNWHNNARNCNNFNPSGNLGGDPDGNGPPSEPDNEGPSPTNSEDEEESGPMIPLPALEKNYCWPHLVLLKI
ncbi:hypothetical protein L218DRAFT_999163 [Marasmius fiardii PR-910]|nr:hypothetical protein L218DRAFT_999163 [Marasmius fiardii PR-910]